MQGPSHQFPIAWENAPEPTLQEIPMEYRYRKPIDTHIDTHNFPKYGYFSFIKFPLYSIHVRNVFYYKFLVT